MVYQRKRDGNIRKIERSRIEVNHGVSKKVRWEHKIDREIQDRSEPWCIKESEMGT